MRAVLAGIASSLLAISLSGQQGLATPEGREDDFHLFALRQFSETLATSPSGTGTFYRLVVYPAFEPAYLVRVEQRPYGYFVSFRSQPSRHGNPSFFPQRELLVRLTPDIWRAFAATVDSLDPCALPASRGWDRGIDGEFFFVEVLSTSGGCRLAYWSPGGRDDVERQFQRIVNEFLGLWYMSQRSNKRMDQSWRGRHLVPGWHAPHRWGKFSASCRATLVMRGR